MIIVCEECGKKYKIDESKMTGTTARLKCRACDNVIQITKPGAMGSAGQDYSDVMDTGGISGIIETETGKTKVKTAGMSIKTKITLIIVILVLISLSVVGFIASYQGQLALSSQAEKHLSMVTAQKSKEYGLAFERIKDEVLGAADYSGKMYNLSDQTGEVSMRMLMPWTGSGYGSPEMLEEMKAERLVLQRIGIMLKSIVSNNPYLSLGYIGSESGMTVFNDEKVVGVIEKLKGFDVRSRPWYKLAKGKRETIWTKPYIDANTKKLVVTCATPVFKDDKTLVGVAGFDVLLDTIQSDILTLDIGYPSYAFLVGSTGNALVRPGMSKRDTRWDETYKTDELLNTDNAQFNRIVHNMIKGVYGVETYSAKGEGKYLAYAPLSVINASMGIVVSKSEVVRPAIKIRNLILVVWVAVFLVSIVIGFVVGNNITRPINELTAMADLISQGKKDLDVLAEDRKDEIGVLTKAFNRLVISLKMAMNR
jgi:predicted Zn finger-like uncharacterized protein